MGKMKKGTKIFLILAVVIVVIAAALIGLVRVGQSALEAMTTGAASYTALERMDLANTLSVSGNIQSADVKKVYQEANGAGKALQVNVEVGDTVAEGDVLCVFDSTDLERTTRRAACRPSRARRARRFPWTARRIPTIPASSRRSRPSAPPSRTWRPCRTR